MMLTPEGRSIEGAFSPIVVETSGLDSIELTVALVVLAVGVLLWGFERYRTNFSKSEFLVSIILSGGIFAIAVFPNVFEQLGEMVAIDRRPFAISLIANVTLVCLVLVLFARTRSNQQSVATLTRNLAIDQATDDPDADTQP